MNTVTFTEFRKSASAVLDRVEKGESIYIVRHKGTIARIIPAAGQGHPEPAWKRPGPRLVIPGASLSRALLEERRSAR